MKKIYLFACATLLAFSGCTNEISEDGFVDKTNAISFSAYPTKSRVVAGDVTTDNMTGDNFGVVGYTHDDNKIYLFKKDNDKNKAVEQTYVPGSGSSSGTWEYANKGDLKFWPEGSMNFYAYFPYSDNATFDNSGASRYVMTIPVDCSHDVLFAYAGNQNKQDRVPLTFHHAFAKMKKLTIQMPADGILYQSNCQIEVKEVEFINTSTKGNIKVNANGIAFYDVASSNETLSETLDEVVTINKTVGNSKDLFDNGTNAKGYFFATNDDPEVNSVIGTGSTGKAMWDGVKTNITSTSGKLSDSELVCLKLTCKVWNGTSHYYVGDEEGNYGEVYIPLKGTDSNSNSITTFDAGKRYTYKIVMKDNVGYTDKGDPILTPILFSASVVGWDDVEVTITL